MCFTVIWQAFTTIRRRAYRNPREQLNKWHTWRMSFMTHHQFFWIVILINTCGAGAVYSIWQTDTYFRAGRLEFSLTRQHSCVNCFQPMHTRQRYNLRTLYCTSSSRMSNNALRVNQVFDFIKFAFYPKIKIMLSTRFIWQPYSGKRRHVSTGLPQRSEETFS